MITEEKERLKMSLAGKCSRNGRTEPQEWRAGASVDTGCLVRRVCASWLLDRDTQ